MSLIKTFADNMRYYRNLKKLSQEELAEIAGIHRTYISGIECYRRNVSLEIIEKIAAALEVSADKLLAERNDNQ